jgi:hypothetical protein
MVFFPNNISKNLVNRFVEKYEENRHPVFTFFSNSFDPDSSPWFQTIKAKYL